MGYPSERVERKNLGPKRYRCLAGVRPTRMLPDKCWGERSSKGTRRDRLTNERLKGLVPKCPRRREIQDKDLRRRPVALEDNCSNDGGKKKAIQGRY